MTKEAELFILAAEGGYVDHPNDPGGATNYGITTATLKQARKTIPDLPEHVRDLTAEQALKIYETFYWKPAGCDKLPSPVDLLVFDGAVNCGVRRGVKFLQEALNVINEGKAQLATDGIIGKKDFSGRCRTFGRFKVTVCRHPVAADALLSEPCRKQRDLSHLPSRLDKQACQAVGEVRVIKM